MYLLLKMKTLENGPDRGKQRHFLQEGTEENIGYTFNTVKKQKMLEIQISSMFEAFQFVSK